MLIINPSGGLKGPDGSDLFTFKELQTLYGGKIITNFPLEITLESLLIGGTTLSTNGRSIVFKNTKKQNSLLPLFSGFRSQKLEENQGHAGVIHPYATISRGDLLFSMNDPTGWAEPPIPVNPIITFTAGFDALFFGTILKFGEDVEAGSYLKFIVKYANEDFSDFETAEELFANTSEMLEEDYPMVTDYTFWFNTLVQALEGDRYFTTVDLHKPDGTVTKLKNYATNQDHERSYGVNIVRLAEDAPIALMEDIGNIFITNITSAGNVLLTRKAQPNEEAVESVELENLTVAVSVEWDRNSSYEGLPTVNGVSVTKTGKTGNTYTGVANISGEYTEIKAQLMGERHGDLVEVAHYIVPLETLDKPIISQATFNDTYPTGQTELKENDTFNIDIDCDVPYDRAEIQEFEACKSSTFTTSGSVSGIIANRGSIAVERNARIRVRNEAGTWSDWATTDNTVNCNNLHPSISVTNASYPTSQLALKDSEEIDIDYTPENSDNEVITVTPNLALSTNGATRNSGDYESGTYTITATREANGAVTTNNTTVRIAHVDVALSNNTPVQVRSGVGAVVLPCTFTQDLLIAVTNPTITATDEDTHALTTLNTQITATNLAGKEIALDRAYFIKGFAQKTLTLNYPDEIANIGTNIVTANDVTVTGIINSTPIYNICTNRVTSGNIALVADYVLNNTSVEIGSQICSEFNYNTSNNIIIQIEEI